MKSFVMSLKPLKVLSVAAAVLLATLFVQIGMRYIAKPDVQLMAAWKDVPKSPEEAAKLADEVIVGKVVRVRRADDLVTKAEGEPNAEDRIPVELVTVRVEKRYKGKAETVELFHVGGEPSPDSMREPPMSQAPPKPSGKSAEYPQGPVDRSKRAAARSGARKFILKDDPEYKEGERYLLFVRKGPNITEGGRAVGTMAIISPTTRFRLSAADALEPVTDTGFAPQVKGRNLKEIEPRIRRQQ